MSACCAVPSPVSPSLGHGALPLLLGLLQAARPGSFALLRPVSLTFDPCRDDVDLLMTPESCNVLRQMAFDRACEGHLHFRIRQDRPEKVRLTIWTLDGSEFVEADVWTAVTQLGPWRNRGALDAGQLLQFVDPNTLQEASPRDTERSEDDATRTDNRPTGLNSPADPLPRLRPDIELCVYILHLAAKKRCLRSERVQERLRDMRERLLQRPDFRFHWLQRIAMELLNATEMTGAHWVPALEHLHQSEAARTGCGVRPMTRSRRQQVAAAARRWMMRHSPCIAIRGCDGVGKSALVGALQKTSSDISAVVAKKLYRRSLLYQLTGGLARRVAGLSRCAFDDRLGRVLTVRATAALWLKRLLSSLPLVRRRVLVLDRCVRDFLIRDRKTDQPVLLAGAWWMEKLVPPATTVLLVLDWDNVCRRRPEMTREGFRRYQQMLFDQSRTGLSTDVLVFANVLSPGSGVHALCRCLGLPADDSSVVCRTGIPAGESVDATAPHRRAA